MTLITVLCLVFAVLVVVESITILYMVSSNNKYRDAVQMAADSQYKRRINDLLQANNASLEEVRKLRAQIRAAPPSPSKMQDPQLAAVARVLEDLRAEMADLVLHAADMADSLKPTVITVRVPPPPPPSEDIKPVTPTPMKL